jgi:hypothetical protein
LLNSEYIKECEQSPFFEKPEIIYLNDFNNKVFEVVQLLKSNFGKIPGYFELLINTYFNDIDILQAKYLCEALAIADSKITEQELIEREKEQYKIALDNKLKK